MLAALPLPFAPLCEHGGAVLGVAAEGTVQLGDLVTRVHVPQLVVVDGVEEELKSYKLRIYHAEERRFVNIVSIFLFTDNFLSAVIFIYFLFI